MEQSDSIGKLAKALSQVQGHMESAPEDATGHFKNRYATLESVWNTCQSLLLEYGLAVIQSPGHTVFIEGKAMATLTTTLAHESGEWMRETLSMPITKQDPQGYGSAITYGRRYALASFVGIVTSDDDGNAASGLGDKKKQPAKQEQASNGTKPIMSWEKFLDYCVQHISRYDNTYAVIAAFNLLNVKPTNDSDERRHAFEMLEVYAKNRDVGRDKEAALVAVAEKVTK